MALIKWDSSMSVNVAEIDRQHQKLIDMINELDDGMRQGKGKDKLASIIGGLASYAQVHFRTEEKYFQQFGYAEAPAHLREHEDFTRKVSDFKAKFDSGKIGLSLEVMSFLSSWLQNHIKNSDMKYAGFFKEKGLS